MNPFHHLKVALFLISLLPPVLSADESNRFHRGPQVSDWVEVADVEWPENQNAEELSGGVHWLLVDKQHRPSSEESFHHFAVRMHSAQGIQDNADLNLNYDPEYQDLRLHFLRIHRDGEIINALDQAQIDVNRSASSPELFLYDKTRSVTVFVPNLRLGDTLEYAYSLRGKNPVMKDLFSMSEWLEWSLPVHQLNIRLLWEEEEKPFIRKHRFDQEPEIHESSLGVEYRWSFKNTRVPETETDTPSWWNDYAWLEVSNTDSWKEIVAWGLPLYDLNQDLGPELAKWVEDLKAENLELEEAAARALRFVQGEFRYLALHDNLHGYVPYPVQEISERRFGDCKDKSMVLVHLLRAIGIPAWPALVDTEDGMILPEYLPTALSFNHMVVYSEIDGRPIWFEATDDTQYGPLAESFFADYGYGLILREGETELTRITPRGFDAVAIDIQETFRITDYENRSAELEVISMYSGFQADYMRSYFRNNSADETEKSYLAFYRNLYDSIELSGPITVSDDLEKNQVIAVEKYLIQDFWTPDDYSADSLLAEVEPMSFLGYLPETEGGSRSKPYALSHPVKIQQKIAVEFPDEWDLESENITFDHPAFFYKYRTYQPTSNSFTLTWQYQSRSETVRPEEFEEFRTMLRGTEELQGYYFSFSPDLLEINETDLTAEELTGGPPPLSLILGALLAFVTGLLVCIILHFIPLPRRQVLEHPDLQGLGGWLILIQIGLWLTLPVLLYTSFENLLLVSEGSWKILTDPSSEAYDPYWAPALLFEVSMPVFLFVFHVYLLIIFLQKRYTVPFIMIVRFLLVIAYLGIDAYLLDQIEFIDEADKAESYGQLARAIVQSCIWIPYFLVSRRVRATFIRPELQVSAPLASEKPERELEPVSLG